MVEIVVMELKSVMSTVMVLLTEWTYDTLRTTTCTRKTRGSLALTLCFSLGI